MATKLIIIETGFPRERANSSSARRPQPNRPPITASRGRDPTTSHKPLNFLNPSHRPMSVWGPKLGFMKGIRPQGRQVGFLVGGGTWKLQIRNRGGDSAAKRREGIISDLLLSQTQTQPQPLSLYPSFDAAAAAGQKSASEPTSESGRSIGI